MQRFAAWRQKRRHLRTLFHLQENATWSWLGRRLFRVRDPWANMWDIAVAQTADHIRSAIIEMNR